MKTASFFTRWPTPRASMACQAFGASWMPAPISANSAACSSTTTRKLRRARPSATARPPMPPPATTTGLALRAAITGTDYRYYREQLNCALRETLDLNRRPACLGLADVVVKCLTKIEPDVAAQGGKVALKSL